MANLPYDCYDWDSIDVPSDPKDDLINECSEYLQDVLRVLYGSASIDRAHLEDLLEELCSRLKVSLPAGLISIERRKNVSMRDYFSDFDMKSLYVTKKTI
jgi:hypothetical protein